MIDDWTSLEEELHRTTADLPRPNPELKRRILQDARKQLHQRTIRRRVVVASCFVMLWLGMGFGLSTLIPQPESVSMHYPQLTSLEELETQPAHSGMASTEWNMVELRTRLRQEYLQLLRSAF